MHLSPTPPHRTLPKRSMIWLLFAVALLWIRAPVTLTAQTLPDSPDSQGLYIVRLRRPSLVEYLVSAGKPSSSLRVEARTRSAEAYDAQLRSEQRAFIDRISSDGRLTILDGCTYLVNAVFVRGEGADVEGLQSDPEVSGVFRSRPRYPMLDGAVDLIGAPTLWDSLGGISEAGRGIKIGIIDSGIYEDHPMFRGEGMVPPPGYPKVDPDRPGDVEFTNNKVIVARTFWRVFPDPNQTQDRTPADQQGHGSRVASIAAGDVTEAPLSTIQGVAPMAFLGNYKIFGSGINATTTTAAVIAAVEQAARDGMDVINLSLGGPALDPGTDPEREAIANAVKLGILVVVAAGNLGPEAETVTSPGTSPDAITVGAVTNNRTFGPGIEIGPAANVPEELRVIAYTPGTEVELPSTLGPFPLATVRNWDPSEKICDPVAIPEGALSGKIALVKRGDCTFQVKADKVFDAGAAVMVVYNNVRGETTVMLFETVRGPSVMIEREAGEALRNLLLSSPGSPLTGLLQPASQESALPAEGDVLATFSGRGPNLDGSLKPDLVAVGTEIYAASNLTNTFSQRSSGTSFSTPMVSGAAALLRQLHRDWSPKAIKSALVSTAAKTPHIEEQPAHLTQMGNGRLDLSRVAALDSYVEPVSISFGFLAGNEPPMAKSLTLTNLGPAQHRYSLRFEPWLDSAHGAVSLSRTDLVLAGGQSTRVDLTLDVGGLPEGGTLEGFLVISEGSPAPDLTVPVWAALVREDPTTTLRVAQEDSTAFRTLGAAIQAAGPGNVIEIADSGTYSLAGPIRINAQGVPLNGLRIRSGPGQSPTIEPSPLAQADPILSVSGLERVTMEGLHIRGGRYGVAFLQSSGVIRDCTIDVDAGSAVGFGIRLSDSRVQVYGNRVTGTDGTGIIVLDSEALIQGNRVGEDGNGRPINGSAVSVATSGATALFDNSLQGGSSDYPGIAVNASSLLIKGTHVFDFAGGQADGIRVTSGSSRLEAVENRIEHNGGDGLSLRDGASAVLRRNRWLGNGSAGIRLLPGTLLTGRAETFLDNAQGIVASGASVDLSDSLVAFSQDQGIGSTDSSLQLINDTIFGNGGAGVSLGGGPATLVANSISLGNRPGLDLVGVDDTVSIHNLTGDTAPAGEPALRDPETGDFSLTEGSGAVDAGREDFVPAMETDLAGHRRVVDGNGDGVDRVDIGALEYGSDTVPPLVLPFADPSADEFIGIALTNARSGPGPDTIGPAAIDLRAHSDGGVVLEDAPLVLGPLSQRARLLPELVTTPSTDWLEVRSDRNGIVGFTLVGDNRLTRLDGISLGNPPSSTQILPEVRTAGGSNTRVFIVNPGKSPAEAVLRRVTPGSASVLASGTIPSSGRLTIALDERIVPHDGGYLVVESPAGVPLSSMELFGSDTSIAALPGISTDRSAGRLYGAQLAVTPAIGSELSLVNVGDSGVLTLEAFSEAGRLAAATTLSLAAGEQWRGDAAGLFGIEELVGWLRVTSDGPRLVGSLTFSDPSGGILASLPLEASGARESIFSHVAQTPTIFTGLTLLNPGTESALISIEVFDAAGNPTGSAFSELGAGEKRARLLPEWIPGLSNQVEGFVRVRANRPILGFELFGSDDYLAAVPQQVVCP